MLNGSNDNIDNDPKTKGLYIMLKYGYLNTVQSLIKSRYFFSNFCIFL